jgi:hypothetical protein
VQAKRVRSEVQGSTIFTAEIGHFAAQASLRTPKARPWSAVACFAKPAPGATSRAGRSILVAKQTPVYSRSPFVMKYSISSALFLRFIFSRMWVR